MKPSDFSNITRSAIALPFAMGQALESSIPHALAAATLVLGALAAATGANVSHLINRNHDVASATAPTATQASVLSAAPTRPTGPSTTFNPQYKA